MSLLSEYALIPDIFMESLYSHEAVADLHLQQLKEALLAEAIVRNLHGGDWRTKIQARLCLPTLPSRSRARSLPLLPRESYIIGAEWNCLIS